MSLLMILKNADTEKKVVGKKNIINELTMSGDTESRIVTELCRKRSTKSHCKTLLRT